MKKYLLSAILIVMSVIAIAQVPHAFNYQAILRNDNGSAKSNETIALQISIVDGSGASVYMEVHNTQTNEFGMVNVVIGEGTTVADLSTTDWTAGPYFLDITVNGVNLGSSPLLSVPYALFAESAGELSQGEPGDATWNQAGEGIIYTESKVGIGTDEPTAELDVDGDLRVRGDIIVDGAGGEEPVITVSALIDLLNRQGMVPNNFAGTVTDIDGNVYRIVRIGDQVWMADNLRVTRYADGSAIPLVEDQTAWNDLGGSDRAYCWYDNDLSLAGIFGGLYTWAAAMNGAAGSSANPSGVQGVCPDGWHLPSDAEWKQLEMHLGMSQAEADNTGWRGTGEGGKLKEAGTARWGSPKIAATNSSGFTALPSGSRETFGLFSGLGLYAGFWSTTETIPSLVLRRGLESERSGIYRATIVKDYGFPVRCLRD